MQYDKSDEYAQGEEYDRHQGGSQMRQEHGAHQRHNHQFLDELSAEVLDGTLDELGAVIGGHDLDSGRETRLQLRELGFYGVNGLQGILAGAHDDDAAGDLSVTVQVRDSAPHLGTDLHGGHVAHPNRDTGVSSRERDAAEILQRLQVTRGANHVLRFGELEHRASGLLVCVADCADHLLVGDVAGAPLLWLHHHLVLANHAAPGRPPRHTGDRPDPGL